MAYSVPSSVLFQTNRCSQGFSCLRVKNGKCPGGCEVLETVGETILRIKSKEDKSTCPYHLAILDEQLCACPTLIALHQQLQQEKNLGNLDNCLQS